MQFETFRGRNVEEALAAVRAAFGADVLIESTRHVSNGGHGWLGKSFVEVVAAPAESVRPPQGGANPFSRQVPARDPNLSTPPPSRSLHELSTITAAAAAEALKGGRSDGGLSRELRAIRSLLEEMTQGRRPKDRANALLQAAGIEGQLASLLATGAARVPR